MTPAIPTPRRLALTALTLLLSSVATAQSTSSVSRSCPISIPTSVPRPSVLPSFQANLVANKLDSPRGATFDSSGHLLVVEKNKGITALTLGNDGLSCVGETGRSTVVEGDDLNHGILLSPNQTTLYASSPEAVYAWSYDPMNASITGDRRTIVNNMTTSDHTTRTLLIPSSLNHTYLVVTRGSTSNLDPEAEDLATGHSTIKAFDISRLTAESDPYDYNNDGVLLGWGLRNDVGIAEHPVTGGLYAVENSADQVMRMSTDIHENNPAEKLNYIGQLSNFTNDASLGQRNNYGYPSCFAAWNASSIPGFSGEVGQQFAIGTPNNTLNDTTCAGYVAPAQVFQAHMAPLDIKFSADGGVAWVAFHGSWDRDDPSGYKVGSVVFDPTTGTPSMPANSTTALTDVLANVDNSQCPDNCFRPVGLAFDSVGRLYVTSDSTGEVYVVAHSGEGQGSVESSVTPSATAGPTASGAGAGAAASTTAASSAGAVGGVGVDGSLLGGVVGGVVWALARM